MRHLILLLTSIITLGFSDISTLMPAGVANEVYVVHPPHAEPHILKIFHRKSLEDLERSELLLQHIRDAGINVPKSIIPPTQVGSKVISVSSYIHGHHIDDSNLPEVAKLMARLHQVKTAVTTLAPLKDYNDLFESCKDWSFCEELKRIFASLDLSYRDNLPRGVIHGDFSYTNLLVTQENKLALLDFDHLRNDILLTDLVRCHLFYGFTQDGQLKEDTIRSFVFAYQELRPLTAAELDAFYTHLKLCLIDVALEMYDHMYVKKDLPVERVDGNLFNCCLNPDLIAKEILSIRDKTSLVLERATLPIFFFGLSGVGKTTLIHLLAQSSDLFYIPRFTVTREPREDDDPRYFEYLTTNEFLQLKDQDKFFVSMNQEGTFYGYRRENLNQPNRFPLLNASAYGIDSVSQLEGIRVLIQGDAAQGLILRNNPELAKTRDKVNRIAMEKFFKHDDFLRKMDLIFLNEFGDPCKSAQLLKNEILLRIDYAR